MQNSNSLLFISFKGDLFILARGFSIVSETLPIVDLFKSKIYPISMLFNLLISFSIFDYLA
jgi:hypothetical protein